MQDREGWLGYDIRTGTERERKREDKERECETEEEIRTQKKSVAEAGLRDQN